jgi:hypothetical protein
VALRRSDYDDERMRQLSVVELAAGESSSSVSRRFEVGRATLRDWGGRVGSAYDAVGCLLCTKGKPAAGPYAHLLGLYLGDGCLSAGKQHRVQAVGCVSVVSYWKHWRCHFPQHGSGPKHLREIQLTDWQRELVIEEPGPFLRGLFHSDGCRVANWTTRLVGGEEKRYEYPRYQFSNESADIMALCQWALDPLAIPWRMPRRNALSVARREGVAVLDRHVGPKS